MSERPRNSKKASGFFSRIQNGHMQTKLQYSPNDTEEQLYSGTDTG